jgi:8-oxo-dGTP pyrophosphatase MutT (NUDIX family)
MTHDPRFVRLAELLSHRPTARQPRAAAIGEAAVSLVLRPGADVELLFIRRALRETDPWSGHIALPGGRRDGGDGDLLATALRETAEETGIRVTPAAAVLGALDEIVPGTPRLPPLVIAPFVVAVPAGARAWPASPEVADTIWVPLPALREPGAISELHVDLGDETLRFPTLTWEGHVIWGLTHRILLQFLEIADRAGV